MQNSSKKIIATCFLAGCLEIYDFTIFGYFAESLHKDYFVFLDKDVSLIISYALFAIGFVFRPIGAIILGHIGDKYGRKKALIASVSMMGVASLGMSILPSYQSIGVIACYILVLLRIIQGLSVGGEYSGAIIFAVEHSKKDSAGLVGSIVVSGCMSGVLLATLVSGFLKASFMPEYSWRFAFMLGFGLSIIGFFIRNKLHETPEFNKVKQVASRVPLFQGLKEAKVKNLAAIFIAATGGVNLYFISVFMPNYVKSLSEGTVSLASIATFTMASLIPIFGYLSDKVGRTKVMIVGASLLVCYTLFLPRLIHDINSYKLAVLVIMLHAFIASIFSGPMNTLIIELFSADKRYSCSAFSYSIGMGWIGGTTPMIFSLITRHFGDNPMLLGLYISFISLLALIMLVIISRKPIYCEGS